MPPVTAPRRPFATVLTAGLASSFALGATLLTAVILAAPASAHAVLVKITPAANSQLTAAPTQVEVEFDEPVSTNFATVVVTNASGVSVVKGKPTVLGAKVTQALGPDLASGTYRIAFQVTSDDGHPVTGESKFTLAVAPGAGPTTPAVNSLAGPRVAAADVPSAVAPKTVEDTGLTRFMLPVTGAVGLLLIGGGVLIWERRRH